MEIEWKQRCNVLWIMDWFCFLLDIIIFLFVFFLFSLARSSFVLNCCQPKRFFDSLGIESCHNYDLVTWGSNLGVVKENCLSQQGLSHQETLIQGWIQGVGGSYGGWSPPQLNIWVEARPMEEKYCTSIFTFYIIKDNKFLILFKTWL